MKTFQGVRAILSRFFCLGLVLLPAQVPLSAEPVAVKHKQGSLHGYILLKDSNGKLIAVGDQLNVAHGAQVRSRLVFHFRDGSIDDETALFRQGSVFRLLSYQHIQKGPSFPEALDVSVNAYTGKVVSRSVHRGKQEIKREHVDLPSDLSNGMLAAVLASFPARTAEMKVSYLAAMPNVRVITLSIKPDGSDSFQVGGLRRDAKRYKVHVELGGFAGVIAPVIGREPSDMEVWVSGGEVPTLIRLQGALYLKGPIWTMELTSPEWPTGPS